MDESFRASGPVGRGRALALLLGGLAGVAGACALAVRGLEPFATWLYPFAWYPLLLALEGGVALRGGRFFVLGRPRAVASLLLWSVPLWMVFELLNLRLGNWYYVLVPGERPVAWLGITISFATVLPAVFLPAALSGLAEGWAGGGSEGHGGAREGERTSLQGGTPHGNPEHRRRLVPPVLRIAGLLFLVLPLVWPRIFFPLVWGALFLLVEPDLWRRFPSASLAVDLREGRRGRILALLAGGALAGLFWESLNWMARARWIYTVPGLEGLKWFEMPPLGFLGFPALALSAHSTYQWLVLHGVAAPVSLGGAPAVPSPRRRRRTWWGRGAMVLAPVVVLAALLGMERWTISSRSLHLRDLPGLLPGQVEDLRVWGVESPFELAEQNPRELAERIPGTPPGEARAWIDAARLAALRGMGARNARLLWSWGVRSPEELARMDPDALARCFTRVRDSPVGSARIRVWQRAARGGAGAGAERGSLKPGCPGG